MDLSFVSRLAEALIEDAVRRQLAGTIYVAGDATLGRAVTRAMEGAEHAKLRVWVLERPENTSSGGRFRLPVDDPRVDECVLLCALTELGGYLLIGRRIDSENLFAFHAADLYIVDGLITALQNAYHLQPEFR